jgi:methionyl-tRNA synthetase
MNLPADEWKKWWQSNDTRYLAFIGKDNIVFHTLIFPAMLHARNNGYILPDNVPANEFLNLEGQKISKSRNWSIDLKDFITDFPEQVYIDTLRYTLAINFPETKDSDFTWKDFQARNNNELSAIFGNFVNRTMQFLNKNYSDKLPEMSEKYKNLSVIWNEIIKSKDYDTNIPEINDNVRLLIDSIKASFEKINHSYDKFRFRDAINETMNIARAANKYFNDEEPWKSIKNDKEECDKTIFICVQLVRTLAFLFSPVIPYTSEKILRMLNIHDTNPFSGKENIWVESLYFVLSSGHQMNQPDLLFKRIEDDIVNIQIGKLGIPETNSDAKQELITIEDFAKVKLRTAMVVEAEKVKKSKKLLKLIVDLGNEKRQILAGVAEHYEPEYLIGKTIVVVANLQPAKLMGLESQGMMLAASTSEGKLCFITPEKEIGIGAEVR